MNPAGAEMLKLQPQTAAVKSASAVVPINVGFFGGQGAGKITSAAMLALTLAKELHGSAPVSMTPSPAGSSCVRCSPPKA